MFRFEQIFRLVPDTSTRAPGEIDREGQEITSMVAEGPMDFLPVYSEWFGKPVVLLVLIRQYPVSMACSIVGESVAGLRVRIHPGWEMEIRKELILAVEANAVDQDTLVN